jgi:hypothetical protein
LGYWKIDLEGAEPTKSRYMNHHRALIGLTLIDLAIGSPFVGEAAHQFTILAVC